MKSNEKKERALEALAFLRKKVEEIFKKAPNLLDIERLSDLPEAKAKVVETQLWGIFAYGEYYVAKVMSDLGGPLLFVQGKKSIECYEKKYKPLIKKMRDEWAHLLSGCPTRQQIEIKIARINSDFAEESEASPLFVPVVLQSNINYCMPLYEMAAREGWVCKLLLRAVEDVKFIDEMVANSPIRQKISAAAITQDSPVEKQSLQVSFDEVLGYAKEYFSEIHQYDLLLEDGEEHYDRRAEHISNIENLHSQDFFAIDEWVANRQDLSLIVVTYPMQNIPTHIKKRVHEIYHSFIFGNWMSAIALSRGVLEYALINQKSRIETQLGRKIQIIDTQGKTKRISELAAFAEEAFPDLKESMEHVIGYGNDVMHPHRKVIPSKNFAKHCVDEISKIISELYSK